jgi:hypothetical protein
MIMGGGIDTGNITADYAIDYFMNITRLRRDYIYDVFLNIAK